MPEGHTLHRLAESLHRAFAGEEVIVSSPQGRFAPGAALLDGLVLDHAEAWGKHLFVEFAGERWLHVHLGLIGVFTVQRREAADGDGVSDRGVAELDPPVTGAVRLRLLNQDWVADLRGPMVCRAITPAEVATTMAKLGPDPLRVGERGSDAAHDPDRAWATIHRSGKTIAELLMDQSVLAGVGNVYRCEVLFRHRLHPMRTGKQLKRASWEAIWSDLVALMPIGVATGRMVTIAEQVHEISTALSRGERVHLDARDSYVYRRTGEPCLMCGSRIRAAPLAGRTLYWCGNCQRRS